MKKDFYTIKAINSKASKNQKTSVFICVCLWLIFLCISVNAQTLAPGAPGKDAQWATAGKQGVGTSANLESKVWFTLAQGVMTEVYYPDVTVANVHLLQFVVVNPKTKKVETEQTDAIHEIKVLRPDSLTFQQINTAKSGEWKITKTYTTDTERASVLIDVKFEPKNKDLNLYVYYDPSLANSGMGDEVYSPAPRIVMGEDSGVTMKESLSSTKDFGLGANDGEMNSALMFSSPISEMTNGYYQSSDGIEQLKKQGRITKPNWKAEKGNVVQMAKIDNPQNFTAILSFAEEDDVFGQVFVNARDSREKGFQKCLEEYEKGWSNYVKTLRQVEPKYQAQFNMAAMQLKALEDKTVRGANIASLTVPWGGGENANENNIGGYHLVWSRDLYQVFTAYMALGDKAAAERALDFLFKVQQKEDGSFPQNSYLDGKPFWGSLQMDEVAYPLIMAYQLKRFDKATWENHVKKAADFIVKNGPSTPQERWEEEAGYSPSTIAAEIAGLVCAAEIAKANNDLESARAYLKTADEWAASIEKWTMTTTGKHSKDPYYVRITQNGKPDAGDKIELNNGAGTFDERGVVDAGFLELVRLGIKSPDDPIIQNSVKVIDEIIRVKTPNGDGFYRYNHDGYGEMDDGRRWNWDGKYTGKGRLWALLSGERGQYELARQRFYLDQINYRPPFDKIDKNAKKYTPLKPSVGYLIAAQKRLDAMQKFANEGLMIPEQIWDSPNVPKNADKQFVPELKFGEGTGSATPLAWSMAQFIRLAVNLQEGKNLDTPDVVYNRYVRGQKNEIGNNFSSNPPPFSNLPLNRRDPKELLNLKPGKPEESAKTNEKKVSADCERAREFLIKGNAALTEQRADWQVPRVFSGRGAEKTAMLFEYFGTGKEVEIAGEFTNWKLCGLKFQDFGKAKILILEFPNAARVEYKFIVDGKWILDPANPNKVDNGVGGENSYFEMPDYKPTAWDSDTAQPIIKDIHELEVESKKFGKRTVKIYLPWEYYKRGIPSKMPVLYLQDGSEYIARAKALNVLENLIAAKKVEPFAIVFIDPKDRMKEYWANDDWADFVALEVVPAVEKKYFSAIKTGRENRALFGASLGGITSFWIGLKHPEVFGRVGGQSNSFWVDDERVVKEIEKLDASKNAFKFYIDDGTLEGVEDSRKVVKILKDKGFDVTYVEGESGHNWTSWRDRLAEAFMALWR